MTSFNAGINSYKMSGTARANTTSTLNQMVNSVRSKGTSHKSSVKNTKNRGK